MGVSWFWFYLPSTARELYNAVAIFRQVAGLFSNSMIMAHYIDSLVNCRA
jgi:hypothetical protein